MRRREAKGRREKGLSLSLSSAAAVLLPSHPVSQSISFLRPSPAFACNPLPATREQRCLCCSRLAAATLLLSTLDQRRMRGAAAAAAALEAQFMQTRTHAALLQTLQTGFRTHAIRIAFSSVVLVFLPIFSLHSFPSFDSTRRLDSRRRRLHSSPAFDSKERHSSERREESERGKPATGLGGTCISRDAGASPGKRALDSLSLSLSLSLLRVSPPDSCILYSREERMTGREVVCE